MPTLDDYIQKPRLREVDEVVTAASALSALELARHFDLARSPLVNALFWLRVLPERLAGAKPPDLHLDAIGRSAEGFLVLEDAPDRLIVGAIGRFWQHTIDFARVPREEFAAFAEPGWGKVAWELRSEPVPGGSKLIFEVRVSATDDIAWHKQERYFQWIGPFSRFIRRHELALIARELGGKLDLDAQRPLAGDEWIAEPKASATDVMVIDAPPSDVWPWLVQMGCRRAGWYSYDLLDNGGVTSAWEIVPELQQLGVGDVLPATPTGSDGFGVLELSAPRALVLGGLVDVERDLALPMRASKPEHFWQSSWAFVLEPLAEQRTRLWVRARVDFGPDDFASRMRLRALGLCHRFMESRQLKNLKLRAEGSRSTHAGARDVVGSAVGAVAMLFDLATPFLRGVRCHWGLTHEEAARSYPGDPLVPVPRWQWTHAVEVDAAPERVWPWIAQLGQDKAGFYSYQTLENLVGCEIQNANRLHPEWTSPEPGDALRLHPKGPALTVHEVRAPEIFLVSAGLDPDTGIAPDRSCQRRHVAVSWLFQLEPRPGGRTRLISRYRCTCSGDLASRLAYGPYIAESVGFVMDRRMLLGVKERAEGSA